MNFTKINQMQNQNAMLKTIIKYPLLFVGFITTFSVLMNILLTISFGGRIDFLAFFLPLSVSATISSLSLAFVKSYVNSAEALATQSMLIDIASRSLNFAVDTIAEPGQREVDPCPEVKRLLGVNPESNLSYDDLVNRVHPSDREKFITTKQSFFSQPFNELESKTERFDCRMLFNTVGYRWVGITWVFTASHGQVNRFVQYTEIEEQKLLKMQLEQLAADRADNLLTVSHEIRTPLNAIVGLSDLLLSTRLTKTQAAYLSKLTTAADTLEILVRNLLDLRRLESGQYRVERTVTNMGDFLSRLVSFHQPVAENKNLSFLINFSPELPRSMETDSLMLEQIVNNLLRNAVKFTSDGDVMLSVRFSKGTASQGELIIEVTDTGSGILESDKELIFQQFERSKSANSIEGAGLGLAIVKRFCDLLHGEITLSSQFGVGSKFTVKIPVTVVDSRPIVDSNELASLSNFKVLLIEPRETIASHINLVLTPWVNLVQTAKELDEAIDLLASTRFDAVLFGNLFSKAEIEHFADACNTQIQDGCRLLVIPKKGMSPEQLNLKASVIDSAFNLQQFVTLLNSKTDISLAETSQSPSFPSPLSKLRVLVAEDNEINQQVLSENLKWHGAEVTMVFNGQQAIDKLSREEFDLILMDIEMPVLDGIEACKRIKAEPRFANIPIIAVSAGVTAAQKERVIEVGMQGFLEKPFKIRNLLATIVPVLSKREIEAAQIDSGFNELTLASATPQTSTAMEFDIEQALEFWPNIESLIENLQLFVNTYPEADDLFRNKSNDDAAKLAHTLKGSASFLGLTHYSMRLGELYLALNSNSATLDMIADAETQHFSVLRDIRSFLHNFLQKTNT